MDKSSFTGSSKLDERFGLTPTVPTTVVDVSPEIDPTDPPKDPDVWESPSGYLRCARHQVFAVILIKKTKEMLMVPYSAIDTASGTFNGDKFVFRFFIGEAPYEATIEGTLSHVQRVFDKLAGGKAEMIRANREEITSITWEAVEEEE